ncbi:hypothetical protein [Streptomyces agglomeratus]|uniref:hypothetical protein n=1 Tax=Streptomyces agglomeratus TaxID=285458 RepID=UPI00114D374F|nr:hypothetical protein [Streptomyces agglomeratus]
MGAALSAWPTNPYPWASNRAVALVFGTATLVVMVWCVGVFRRANKVAVSLPTWLACLTPMSFYLLPWLGALGISASAVGYGVLASVMLTRWLLYRTSRQDVRREQWRRDAEARQLTMQAIDFTEALRDGRCTGSPPRFAVYLRPFDSTHRLKSQPASADLNTVGFPVHQDLETLLYAALPDDLPLIGAGREGDVLIGAGRVVLAEDSWQQPVIRLAEAASLIILIPSANPGTLWEMQWLLKHGALSRTVFVMPELPLNPRMQYSIQPYLGRPFVRTYHGKTHFRDHAAQWDRAVQAAAQIGLRLPPYRYEGALFTLADTGALRALRPLGLVPRARRVRRVTTALRELGVAGAWRRSHRASPPAAPPARPLTYTPPLRIRLGRSIERNGGPLVFAFLLTLAGVALPFPWRWIPLAGLALVIPYWSLCIILEALGFPTLRIDRTGIFLNTPLPGHGPWEWTWESLATVEIQSAPGALVLTAVPIGGTAPALGTAKRFFWHHNRYAIADLSRIGADERVVAAALAHCSAGRFRTPSARLPFRNGPDVPQLPSRHYEIGSDCPPAGWPERWRPDSSGWLRERTASRARHCAGWLMLGGTALSAWIGLVTAIDGALELLALPLAGFAVYALLKKAPVAWDGKRLCVTQAGLTFLPADSDTPVHTPWAGQPTSGLYFGVDLAGMPHEEIHAAVARIRPAP